MLAIWGLLCFYTKAIGIVIGIALNLSIAFRSIVILTILILPIQEHVLSFHQFISSSVTFISPLQFSKYRSFTSLVKVVVTQSCPTLCNPMDYSPPDSSVHGILQARIQEWVAIPFSRGTSRLRAWETSNFFFFKLFGYSLFLSVCTQMPAGVLSRVMLILYHLSHEGSPFYIFR